MAIRYSAYLKLDSDSSSALPVLAFELTEEYNTGWEGNAVLGARLESGTFGLDQMLTHAVGVGVHPGAVATLVQGYTEVEETSDDTADESSGDTTDESDDDSTEAEGYISRAWPSVVTRVEPFDVDKDPLTAQCTVELADPMTYLASRPVWGAYRAASVGNMLGGALSMAAGGDGKPTLNPVLPGLPITVTIVEKVRDDLKRLPFAIASGETFGEWLTEVTSLLGLRVELGGNASGQVTMTLTDSAARGTTIDLAEATPGGSRTLAPANGTLRIDGLATHPPPLERGAVLDDFTLGSFRYLGRSGTLGSVQTGSVGVEEAQRRLDYEAERGRAEMVMLMGSTGHPMVRPGWLAALTPTFLQTEKWQFCKVVHAQSGAAYANKTVLMPSAAAWHPLPPLPRPPRMITAVVHAGDDYLVQEPVPRDRLGRVPVAFPFAPTPIGDEAIDLALADTDYDRRITLDDFSAADVDAYENGTPSDAGTSTWDQAYAAYQAGTYDDPYPDLDDDELDDTQSQSRTENEDMRRKMRKYGLYKEAKDRDVADRDRDGRVTTRDTAMSDRLKALMDDPAQQAELDAWWKSYSSVPAGSDGGDPLAPPAAAGSPGATVPTNGLQALQRDFPDDYDRCLANLREIIEYGALFYGEGAGAVPEDAENLPEGLEAKHRSGTMTAEIDAWEEAELADELWPPRVPLPLVVPMAGALHGFIQPHRQGDACRVAVHNPLHAEILGFQYRSNRPINDTIVDATAGLVVEHDRRASWSGWLFRPGAAGPSPIELEAQERAASLEKLQAQAVTDTKAAKAAQDHADAMKIRHGYGPRHADYASPAEVAEAEEAALQAKLKAARSRAAAANAQAAIAASDAVAAPSLDATAWRDATLADAKAEEHQVAELEATLAAREAAAAQAAAEAAPSDTALAEAAAAARRRAEAVDSRARAAAAIAATTAARARASEAAMHENEEEVFDA